MLAMKGAVTARGAGPPQVGHAIGAVNALIARQSLKGPQSSQE